MEEKNVKAPIVITTKEYEEGKFALMSISGDRNLFYRLGEFLAAMCEQEQFYFQSYDDEGGSSVLVDMEPIDGDDAIGDVHNYDAGHDYVEGYDDEEITTNSAKDMVENSANND